MVESVKTASDVYSPVAGKVTDENWLMRVRPVPDALAAPELLSAAQYTKILETQGG